MKQAVAIFLGIAAFLAKATGGTSTTITTKDIAAAPPCPSWYADRECTVSLWGSYAFTQHEYPSLQNAFVTVFVPSTVPDHDRYLEADHAWGGGIDAKFFFARYFGIGVEGYALNVRQSYPDVNVDFFNINGHNFARTAHDQRAIGAAIATFTLRYPIRRSRLAPYLFAGGGAIFGGGQPSKIIAPPDAEVSVRGDIQTKIVGQVGGGFEVRLTPHIGLLNDFTWNIVDGRRNDFGMARTGINIAF
jgi:hypothetical protein